MMTDQWIQDLRFALRGLARQPGFAVVATLTLALGIGATTALFSVVDGVLLRPFPYRDADQLVRVVGVRRGVAGTTPVSYPNAMDLGRTAETLTGLATFDEWYPALTTADGMVPVYGATVNASFFDVLGVEPALGRSFRADEEGSGREPRLVVTHRFWRDRLRADPGALGSSVVLNGLPYTLVGVLPDTFEDPRLQGRRWGEPQVWRTPWFEVADEFRSGRSYAALARLRSGTSLEAAQAEADVVFAGLESAFPEENRDRQVRLVSLGDAVVGGARPGLLVLLGGVGMVLLIACVNVANLLLVRGTSRSTEMDVRQALGASRGRLLGQLVTESLVLALVGGGLGVALAFGATGALAGSAAAWLPRAGDVEVSGRALIFASLVTAATGVLFGLFPALRTARVRGPGAARGASEGRMDGRVRRSLVVAEVALSTTLLIGAGLLVRNVWTLYRVDLGMEVDQVLAVDVHPSVFRPMEEDELDPWFDGILAATAGVSGVERVGGVDIVPLGGSYSCDGVQRNDLPPPPPGEGRCAEIRAVVGDPFGALGLDVGAGRTFTEGDRMGTERVAVVNTAMARDFWPDGPPVGASVTVHGETFRVVGVVADMLNNGPLQGGDPMLFVPATQDPWLAITGRGVTLLIRSRTDAPARLADAVRAAILAADRSAPISDIRPLSDLLDEVVAAPRYRAEVLGAMALAALGLAIVGIAGVMAHSVARRRREIGIRIAVGAGRRRILWMVVGEGLTLTLLGTAVGLLGAVALSRALETVLFGVGRFDPLVFVSVPLVLVAAAFVACATPALHAGRIEPTQALRAD